MMHVIVYPRGQLRPADKKKLKAHGFLAVEADDPKQVVVLLPSASMLTGNDLLLAAMRGVMAQDGKARLVFSRNCLEMMEAAKGSVP